QVTWAAELLRPLWRAALAGVLGAQVMHLDATGLPVLDRNVDGGKRLGTLWGYVGGETVAAYLYTSTGKKLGQRRGELGPEDVLALRTGFTVADASNLFEASFRRPQLIARRLQEALRDRGRDPRPRARREVARATRPIEARLRRALGVGEAAPAP